MSGCQTMEEGLVNSDKLRTNQCKHVSMGRLKQVSDLATRNEAHAWTDRTLGS